MYEILTEEEEFYKIFEEKLGIKPEYQKINGKMVKVYTGIRLINLDSIIR